MNKNQKIAFIFPGQGAQYVGMGKDIVQHFAIARQTYEEADDILGRGLSDIILEGPDLELTATRNSQAGIFVTSVAILRVLYQLMPELKPAICAGLSLGEYTALYASGRIAFADCLSLVQHRGEYMNAACEAVPGTMAVIMGLDADLVENMVKEINLPHDLWVANFNCPGQVVISGTSKGIEAGTAAAKAKGAKRVLPLQVHGAFHSGLMQEAEQRLAPHVSQVKLNESPVTLIMNVVGAPVRTQEEIRGNLIKQVTGSVRWEQGIRAMGSGCTFIEIGCGKVLAGFNKRIVPEALTVSVDKMEDLKNLEAIFA